MLQIIAASEASETRDHSPAFVGRPVRYLMIHFLTFSLALPFPTLLRPSYSRHKSSLTSVLLEGHTRLHNATDNRW